MLAASKRDFDEVSNVKAAQASLFLWIELGKSYQWKGTRNGSKIERESTSSNRRDRAWYK